jgi:2-hydroxy-3-keto-5-methylthiopentenyl-1-phosphate phosphatase
MTRIRVSDWTILCDFDGTAALDDTTDTLLETFGRDGWEALEAEWRAGKIGSRECMAGQVALLDMDRTQLDAHLAARKLDASFAEFIALTRELGIHVEILSDGLDYAIHKILARYELDGLPVTSNKLDAVAARRWKLTFPNASTECRVASGTCKCACSVNARAAGKHVLLIGDGASDFCAADRVDFVFAKHRLIEHCRAAGIDYVPITGFEDALEFLPMLLDGSLASHAHHHHHAPVPALV